MSTCRQCARHYPDDHHFCPIDGEPLCADDFIGMTLLDQYRLTRVIGQGSSGTVYEAWEGPTSRRVAVKMLNPSLVADETMVRRFQREARAAARLAHPNVITLYTAGVTDQGVPFLVMELAPGESLDRVLAAGPVRPARAVEIIRQVVAAVAATHAAGIVHRDLKPANVIVEVGSTFDRVKLVDFGVAKFVGGEGGDDSALSRTGTVWGTPHYLAPEQARGEQVDGRADLYSIGVMLYEMVTGQVPFPGTGVAVLLAHVNRPVPPLDARVPDLDPRLAAVIMGCLAKSPGDRFASAGRLAAALDEIANDPEASVAGKRSALAGPGGSLGAAARGAEPVGFEAAPDLSAAVTGIALDPSFTAHLEPRRRGRWWVALLAAGCGFAASHWINLDPPMRPEAEMTRTAAIESAPPAVTPPGIRVVVVAEGGYALRVLLPERVVVGVDYEILIDAWDRDGEPIAAPELIVTIDDPTGVSRGVAAKPTSERGRFRFHRDFPTAGSHVMRVYPPAGGARIQVFYDVVGASEWVEPTPL